tara:strand:- start:13699 stop:13929 length:231 start_codon:yes stop_codon:yes gene_type:complete
VNIGQSGVLGFLHKLSGSGGVPAFAQFLQRTHIQIAVVKISLKLGHVLGHETAVLANAVATHGAFARANVFGQKFN